jgi:preprotein translocase subunit SecE
MYLRNISTLNTVVVVVVVVVVVIIIILLQLGIHPLAVV